MEFTVENNRKVVLKGLYQWETYKDLLEGVPSSKLNAKIISRTLERVKEFCYTQSPYLIQPQETPIDYSRPPEFGVSAQLPKYICIARLESSQSLTGSGDCYSILGVLWFQDHFALPIEESILKELEKIPWGKVAQDYEL